MNKVIFTAILSLASVCAIAQTTNPSPYCDASFDDAQGFHVDDHISAVSFGTLNNTSNSQYAAPHYVHYNNLPVANFTKGSTYTLTVKFNTAGGCGYGIWIDYNNNKVFEASEKIAGTTGTTMLAVGATPSITQSVTIPATAVAGNTRMRIRIVEDDMYNMTTTDQLPCNKSTSDTDVMDWGETEDYTINIVGTSGVDGIHNANSFVVAPNPSNGIFTITTDNEKLKNIEVYSMFGTLISKQIATGSMVKLDLSNQSKGIYFIRVMDTAGVMVTNKITIE